MFRSVPENKLLAIQNELLPLRNAHELLQSDIRKLQNLTDEQTATIDTVMMQLNQLRILSLVPPVKLPGRPLLNLNLIISQAPSDQICNSLSDVKSARGVRRLDDEFQENVKLADISVTGQTKSRDLQPTEDELLIIFEKIIQQQVTCKSLINSECNIICRFFESGFCRKKNRCQYLHVCRYYLRML